MSAYISQGKKSEESDESANSAGPLSTPLEVAEKIWNQWMLYRLLSTQWESGIDFETDDHDNT